MKEGSLHGHVRVRVRAHVRRDHCDDCSRVRGCVHDRGHDCKNHGLTRSNLATAAAGDCDDLCGLNGNVRVRHYSSDQARENANGPRVQQFITGSG